MKPPARVRPVSLSRGCLVEPEIGQVGWVGAVDALAPRDEDVGRLDVAVEQQGVVAVSRASATGVSSSSAPCGSSTPCSASTALRSEPST